MTSHRAAGLTIAVATNGGLSSRIAIARPYILALADQGVLSLVNFVVALTLLRLLDAPAFGVFTLLTAVANAAVAVQEALTATPLSVRLVTATSHSRRRWLVAVLANATCLYALAGGGVVGAAAAVLSGSPALGVAAGLFVTAYCLRSFLRAVGYARQREMAALLVDVPSGLLSLLVLPVLHMAGALRLDTVLLGLAAANAIPAVAVALSGLVPLALPSWAGAVRFGQFWHEVRWTLLGVGSTLCQQQAHAVIVPVLTSAAAFGMLATADALMGPVRLAVVALGMVMRPELTRLLAAGDTRAAARLILGMAAGLTALMAGAFIALMLTWDVVLEVVLAGRYPGIGGPLALAGAVTLVVGWRCLVSYAIQARRRFRELAWSTVVCGPASLAATAVATLVAGPQWALAGVLLGELGNLGVLLFLLRRTLHEETP